MPIKYAEGVALFEGTCKLNEAELLYKWLEKTPDGELDLTDCKHIHTAIMQVLLAANSTVMKMPDDAFLRHCIAETQTSRGQRG